MSRLIVRGKKRLEGSVFVENSKNAILPILAACVMAEGPVKICGVPKFSDIENMLKILKNLGAKVKFCDGIVEIDSTTISSANISGEISKTLRASIFLMGPLLSRFGKCTASLPGGCNIGARPIDIHLQGLKQLGVNIIEQEDLVECDAKYFIGGVANLKMPSVGATENLIMAAARKESRVTKIVGAAREPEIVDLCEFLNKMGAKIFGAGTSVVTIYGVGKLNGCEYTPIADRIVAGTYLIATAMCGGKVLLKNAKPEHNERIISILSNLGCTTRLSSDNICVCSNGLLDANMNILTDVYPGLATDLQSQLVAMLATVNGKHTIIEQLFENRFKVTKQLAKMGANIHLDFSKATIFGKKDCLHGELVEAGDLRGGAALVLAGLVATGTTQIENAEIVDRGYESIEQKLAMIGADISRK